MPGWKTDFFPNAADIGDLTSLKIALFQSDDTHKPREGPQQEGVSSSSPGGLCHLTTFCLY